MVQHILPPALPARLEEAERGEELIDMARATEEAVADWRFCGLELSGGSLRDMRFERCEFSGCRFTGADLSRATFWTQCSKLRFFRCAGRKRLFLPLLLAGNQGHGGYFYRLPPGAYGAGKLHSCGGEPHRGEH